MKPLIEDGFRASKRRRLNIVGGHRALIETLKQPHEPQQQPSLVQPDKPNLEPHGQASRGTLSAGWNNIPREPGRLDNDVASSEIVDDSDHRHSECCYGMLSDIPVKLKNGLGSTTENIPVDFQCPNNLSSRIGHDSINFEVSCQRTLRILSELQSVTEIETQLYCYPYLQLPLKARTKQRGGNRERQWFLNIIIFGTEGLERQVGEYLSNFKMYLQDPLHCCRCVPYRNPHILQPESGDTVMTDIFDSVVGDLEVERLEVGPDLLAQLMGDKVELLETDPPNIVKTALFRHQKQALTFMLQREEGWALEGGTVDIWSRRRDVLGKYSYIDNVSGTSSNQAPPDFRGGLLADDMGLGKTLSMICLIAANRVSNNHQSPCKTTQPLYSISPLLKTTLLVVPPALIQAWEKQFNLHVRAGELKYYIYHGQNRADTEALAQYDVVVTTYHTVSAIWRKRKGTHGSERSIFSLTWHRVILDEAHTIQNPRSQLAQACCALRSSRRWAISGTPIQNKLADFASIVKFLQVYPYSDPKVFDEEIIRPWHNRHGTDTQGFLKLKTLVRAITISRKKDVVSLPTRIDEVHHLNFTPAEREKYEAAKMQSRMLLEEAISSGKSGKTFNALWLLNRLRLICNHGLHEQFDIEQKAAHMTRSPLGDASREQALSPFEGDRFDGAAVCFICGMGLLDDFLQGSASSGLGTEDKIAACGRMICELCSSQTSGDGTLQVPWNNRESLSSSRSSRSTTPVKGDDVAPSAEHMSTKIKALAADLSKHQTTGKSVVFSYWTHTLDLVQLMLKDCGIACTRIDGKTSLSRRTDALRAFQHDNSIRVILVSITCGGAGIDLTAGSRAYLLEPHWNPMIEEQALSRIHRVGQRREITTVRYLMRDSFEEQIVDIQNRKRMLAQVTFAPGPLSAAGINLGMLQYLKTVLE